MPYLNCLVVYKRTLRPTEIEIIRDSKDETNSLLKLPAYRHAVLTYSARQQLVQEEGIA